MKYIMYIAFIIVVILSSLHSFAQSTETDILTFTLPEETTPATIDAINNSIDLEVAYGTDVTSLTPTFSLSTGASATVSSIAQISGTTANDFTLPVTYTVLAEDGITTQDWTLTVTVDDGLVAYYPFNGNANDESGNGNNGTGYEGVSLTTDRFGNANSAYSFDGVDDYIALTDIDLLQDFTLSAWVNINSFNPSEASAIIDKYPNFNDAYSMLLANDGELYGHTITDGLPGSTCFSTGTVPLNQWKHIIMSLEGSDIKFYIDGNFVYSCSSMSQTNDNAEKTLIGRSATYGNPFDGKIDDVRIYNQAISDVEIQSIYNEGGWPLPSAETDIITFSHPEQTKPAIIDPFDHRVHIEVAYSADISSLTPSFTLSSGASATVNSIVQTSGVTSIDFANSVTYLVTAENGTSTQNWVVNVVYPLTSFVDARDGNSYRETIIGSQVWMADNLAYLPSVSSSASGSQTDPYYYVYDYEGTSTATAKSTANYNTYGVIYNWPAAMAGMASSTSNPSGVQGVCPSGWHLPSDEEWTQLINTLGGTAIAGGKLKEIGRNHWISPNTGATDETRFTALPAGYRYAGIGQFSSIGNIAGFWSATEFNSSEGSDSYMLNNTEEFTQSNYDKEGGFSVRCVRAASTETDILTFTLPEQTIPATIDAVNHTVDIEVANGTDITALTPSFTLSKGATTTISSVNQVSGTTANDYTLPVTYSIIAEDGLTTQDWVVTAYIDPPTISWFTPISGPIGTSVTITGTNFDVTPANNTVFFGATQATVTSATTTQLIVTVPTGATYQPITVLNNGLIAYSAAPFVVTFTGGGTIDANSFDVKVDYSTLSGPRAISIVDLDNDGKADLAMPTYVFGNTLSVLRNTSPGAGTIAYAAEEIFSTGSYPNAVSIGDLDGDGRADLAVANRDDNTVSVFRNTSPGAGTISFASKVDYTTGSEPISVSIGDFDSDGKADLVVSNRVGNTVSVLRNTSSGAGEINFTPKVDFTTGSNSRSVSIGDFDGDGMVDLAVANWGDNTVSVLRNTSPGTGTISFATKVDFATGSGPNSVSLGDLNGDGKADLAAANSSGNTVSIFRNTSTGPGSISYADKVDFTTGSNPFSVSIADLDGDGNADLAVANRVDNTVSALMNTIPVPGEINFTPKVDFSTGTDPLSVSIGDVDGDGKADLVVVHLAKNVSVLQNTIASTKTEILTFTLPEQTSSAAINAVNHTIDIEVTYGTDVTSLIPTFTLSTGASATISTVAQVSGTTANDFTNPVSYAVLAEDGVATQDWAVNVHQVITDIDGNSYKIVQIGTQTWMAENLKTINYNDGTAITLVSDNAAWSTTTSEAFSWYNNDEATFKPEYGALYNWYAVNTGNLCPVGWQVPTDTQWTILTDFLGGQALAGGKLKEAGISHWTTPNTGATNESGFGALPGGFRNTTGAFAQLTNETYLWSSTESSTTQAWFQYLTNTSSSALLTTGNKNNPGFSVRCLKIPPSSETDILTFTLSEQTAPAAIDAANYTVDIEVANGTDLTSLIPTFTLSTGASTTVSAIAQVSATTANDYTSPVTYNVLAEDGITTQDWTITVHQIITDVDGNDYKVVVIGTQTWMAENLKTKNYNDGTPITLVTDGTVWGNIATASEAYCWYNNDEATHKFDYGALYNWYAVNTGNLCPTSWNVPTDEHWTTLSNYLGGDAVAGGKLKEAGLVHWASPNTGATNESGFTARPAGYRAFSGAYDNLTVATYWWSSNEVGTDAGHALVTAGSALFMNSSAVKRSGLSIRCIKSSADTDILTFALADQTAPATVDALNHTIDIEVTYSATLAALIPSFTLSSGAKASVSTVPQISAATANDFTTSVSYTITAEDKTTTQQWLVSVTVAANTATDILTFSFPDETSPASINNLDHSISIEVANSTDVTSLIPTFTLSDGASATVNAVAQLSEATANDFTLPVTYAILAEDGFTTQDWTVTITFDDGFVAYYPFNSNVLDETVNLNHGTENGGVSLTTDRLGNDNSAYSFDGVDDNISIAGASSHRISQSSSFAITGWFLYDGTGQNWLIQTPFSWLFIAPEGKSLVFHLPADTGVDGPQWQGNDLNKWIHFAATYDGITARLHIDGIEVASMAMSVNLQNQDMWPIYLGQTSDSQYHFAGKLDEVRIYNRTLSVSEVQAIYIEGLNTETDILTFTLPELISPATIDAVNHTVALEVAYSADITSLAPTFTLSAGASATIGGVSQVSGTTSNDFTLLVSYAVLAEDGISSQDWTVTVSAVPSSATDILTFTLPEQTAPAEIDVANHTVAIEVYGSDKSTLIPSFTLSTGASATVGGVNQVSGTTSNNFTNPVTYTILAEDGITTQNWTVAVTVLPSNEALILSYSLPTQTSPASIEPSIHTINIEVAIGTDIQGPIATFTLSEGATAQVGGDDQISGTTSNDFSNPVTYTVTAEDGITTRDWLVYVAFEADLIKPNLSVAAFPEIIESGGNDEYAMVNASDNAGPPTVTFFSRLLNIAAFSGTELSSDHSEFGLYISEDMVTDTGLAYFFLAEDASGNKSSTDTVQITIRYTGTSGPMIPNLSKGGQPENWRMFSIPFVLDDKTVAHLFENPLGTYAKSKWRIVHYKNDTEGFVEYRNGLSVIERGKGYWFNSVENANIPMSPGNAPPNTNKNLASLILTQGWNQIGNPYTFDVSWTEVLAFNAITDEVETNLRVFENGTSLNNSTMLNAFSGAYLWADQAVTLQVPLHPSVGGRLSGGNDFAEGWLLGLSAEAGIFSNKSPAIGMHPEGKYSHDQFDQVRSPRFANYVDLTFEHPEYLLPYFSRDIIPNQEFYVWEFEFATNVDTPTRVLSWQNTVLGADKNLVLLDRSNGDVIDMTSKSQYTYTDDYTRSFKIIYGNNQYLLEQLGGDRAILGDNYPNPFSDGTAIPFSLFGENDLYHVALSIYSINGVLIKTLLDSGVEPGSYIIEWDGKDGQGGSLSGLFIYTLQVESEKGVENIRKKLIIR